MRTRGIALAALALVSVLAAVILWNPSTHPRTSGGVEIGLVDICVELPGYQPADKGDAATWSRAGSIRAQLAKLLRIEAFELDRMQLVRAREGDVWIRGYDLRNACPQAVRAPGGERLIGPGDCGTTVAAIQRFLGWHRPTGIYSDRFRNRTLREAVADLQRKNGVGRDDGLADAATRRAAGIPVEPTEAEVHPCRPR